MYGNTEICQSVSEKSRVSAVVSLIVPGLMFATSMPLMYAIGTSLVAVTAFGAATAASYAASGLIDWRIAALFILGGVVGGAIGVALCRVAKTRVRLSLRKRCSECRRLRGGTQHHRTRVSPVWQRRKADDERHDGRWDVGHGVRVAPYPGPRGPRDCGSHQIHPAMTLQARLASHIGEWDNELLLRANTPVILR